MMADILCCICIESLIGGLSTGSFPTCSTSNNGVPVSSIPCGHVFHTACILEWMDTSNTCPRCRFSINCESLSPLYLDGIGGEGAWEVVIAAFENQKGRLEDMEIEYEELRKELVRRDEVLINVVEELSLIEMEQSQLNDVLFYTLNQLDTVKNEDQLQIKKVQRIYELRDRCQLLQDQFFLSEAELEDLIGCFGAKTTSLTPDSEEGLQMLRDKLNVSSASIQSAVIEILIWDALEVIIFFFALPLFGFFWFTVKCMK